MPIRLLGESFPVRFCLFPGLRDICSHDVRRIRGRDYEWTYVCVRSVLLEDDAQPVWGPLAADCVEGISNRCSQGQVKAFSCCVRRNFHER